MEADAVCEEVVDRCDVVVDSSSESEESPSESPSCCFAAARTAAKARTAKVTDARRIACCRGG